MYGQKSRVCHPSAPQMAKTNCQTSQTVVAVTHQRRWQPPIGVSHRAEERIWATKAHRPVKHTPLASSCFMLLTFLIPSSLQDRCRAPAPGLTTCESAHTRVWRTRHVGTYHKVMNGGISGHDHKMGRQETRSTLRTPKAARLVRTTPTARSETAGRPCYTHPQRGNKVPH